MKNGVPNLAGKFYFLVLALFKLVFVHDSNQENRTFPNSCEIHYFRTLSLKVSLLGNHFNYPHN